MQDNSLFLGGGFFAWMMLAFGGALLAGNILAMIRPPAKLEAGSPQRPPMRRTLPMASIGLIITVWSVASLTYKA